jgi:hypothetical protein
MDSREDLARDDHARSGRLAERPWTKLQIVHSELEPDSKMFHSVSYGWPGLMSALKTMLAKSVGTEPSSAFNHHSPRVAGHAERNSHRLSALREAPRLC